MSGEKIHSQKPVHTAQAHYTEVKCRDLSVNTAAVDPPGKPLTLPTICPSPNH